MSSTRSSALSPVAAEHGNYVTIDRFVRHVSTVPANAGQVVGIWLHEKLLAEVAEQMQHGATAPVVLFLEGGTVSSVPDYDFPFNDYSWMAFLARAGFDPFSMDVTGYGFSPRARKWTTPATRTRASSLRSSFRTRAAEQK